MSRQRQQKEPARAERVIAVIYAGGTIGMQGQPLKAMKPLAFKRLLAKTRGFLAAPDGGLHLLLPSEDTPRAQRRHIELDFVGDMKPLDSSRVVPTDWADIAIAVAKAEEGGARRYDGIVVLHGTDTLAWTASALSLLLGDLRMPVVLTGSQTPLSHSRTDALRNLITAVEFAADEKCPKEVCVFFDQVLLRGNRATKVRSAGYDGFTSPNFAPLAWAGTALNFSTFRQAFPVMKRTDLAAWRQGVQDVDVRVLRAYPGMQAPRGVTTQDKRVGIVLDAYGAGTASSDGGLRKFLTRARKHNQASIVLRTQVPNGAVEAGVYEAAEWLRNLATPGSDITSEACTAKLYYLLGRKFESAEIERALTGSLRGEVTLPDCELLDGHVLASSADATAATTGQVHYQARTDEYMLMVRLAEVLARAGVKVQRESRRSGQQIDLIAQLNGITIAIECCLSAYGVEKAQRDVQRFATADLNRFAIVGQHFTDAAKRVATEAGGTTVTWDEAFKRGWPALAGEPPG